MSTAGWGITRTGYLTLFNRDAPSCFSNRVARVRRSNSLEDRRLQEKLRTIRLEHSIRNGQIYNEKKTLVSQLTGIQRVRETPEVGLERRKLLQAKAGNQVVFHKAGCSVHSSNTRSHSAASFSRQAFLSSQSTPSSAVTQYPSVDCRCCYTGYRLRRASPTATSPDWRSPRSPAFPLFSSVNESSKETLGFASTDDPYSFGIPSGLVRSDRQGGLNFRQLPTIENNR